MRGRVVRAGGGTDVLPEASPEVCADVDAVGGSSWVIFSLGGRADTRAGLAHGGGGASAWRRE
ncbi:hypothetical protein GCM10010499_06040 [Streptomyces thermoviolaceus subsp. apingens]|nr:hypothetical protein GCM10010499_06040 [Streptomyces thermoviolaceus subsp. apingens]